MNAAPNRNVQIRTPLHKQTLYADSAAPTLLSSGHVLNGDFEGSTVGSNWGGYMDGYTIGTADVNGGTQSIKVVNGGARQWVTVTVNEGNVVEISGYSKRVGGKYMCLYCYVGILYFTQLVFSPTFVCDLYLLYIATGSAPWDYSIYAG